MNNNEDLYQKLSKQYTKEELVEAFVFPHGLSEEEKQKADAELWAFRKQLLAERTPEEQMYAGLLRIKYQLQDTVLKSEYNAIKTTAFYLKDYMQVVHKKQKDLAQDLAIHPTRLSRILNNREHLSLAIAYRLEGHSGDLIPAILWWKLLQKEIEQEIKTNRTISKQEKQKLRNVAYPMAS